MRMLCLFVWLLMSLSVAHTTSLMEMDVCPTTPPSTPRHIDTERVCDGFRVYTLPSHLCVLTDDDALLLCHASSAPVLSEDACDASAGIVTFWRWYLEYAASITAITPVPASGTDTSWSHPVRCVPRRAYEHDETNSDRRMVTHSGTARAVSRCKFNDQSRELCGRPHKSMVTRNPPC